MRSAAPAPSRGGQGLPPRVSEPPRCPSPPAPARKLTTPLPTPGRPSQDCCFPKWAKQSPWNAKPLPARRAVQRPRPLGQQNSALLRGAAPGLHAAGVAKRGRGQEPHPATAHRGATPDPRRGGRHPRAAPGRPWRRPRAPHPQPTQTQTRTSKATKARELRGPPCCLSRTGAPERHGF